MLRHRPGPLALLAASAVLPGAVLEAFGSSTVAVSGRGHFALVGVAALVAAVASIGLTAAGVRRRDGQTTLLRIAFSTMTAMLAVHGIATPGVLFGPNGVVAVAGGLSLPVGAAVLALTALPAVRTTRRMGRLLALPGAVAGGGVGVGAPPARARSPGASSASAPPDCCAPRSPPPCRRAAAAPRSR